ncbi:ATP-binding protein [Photobacterium rosenbergii]|uniref:histidine kinase n=1 Tax=Photobacterium rosenbergii TaxID=294936 RepID=A0ABU3ZL84_9GAMM|nr:ATP-binding protein [Photobacterium rosenbergii]MDV5170623.1 ATP-binding protein [Photobacterium rosenbergii]
MSVRKIVDDTNKGFWLVDIRGQLLFYDGTNLKPAVERTGKPVTGVTDVALVNNTLWLVKDNHAFSYSPQTASLKRHNISQVPIESVVSMGDAAWFANRRGLYQLSDLEPDAKFLPFPHPIKLAGLYVAGNHLYVAAQQGVYEYLSFSIPPTKLFPDHNITAVEQDMQGELWFGTRQGVIKGREGVLHPLQKQSRPAVLSLQATTQGMWVGSTMGLYLMGPDMETKAHFMPSDHDKYALPGRRVLGLHQDQQGTLWVSTPEGISQLPAGSDLLNRIRLGKGEGLIDASFIADIAYGSNGHYWLATDNGLFEVSPLFEVVGHIASLGKIKQLALSGDQLWVLKEDGITTYDISQSRMQSVDLPKDIQAASVSRIMVDHFDSLWVGYERGLYRYWPEFTEWMPFGSHWLRDPVGGEQITNILEDSEYQVWVGTTFGMYKFDAGMLHFVPGSENRGGVVDIYEDRMGQLWVATNYALQVSPTLKPLKLQDVQLSSDFALPHCIVGGNNGVWLSSSSGLSFISYYGELKQHLSFNSGLLPEDVGSLACLQDDVNALVLGYRQGLLSISHDALFDEFPAEPELALSAVRVDNDIWPLGDSWSQLRRLPYGSTIAFKLETAPSRSTLYQYRLVDENEQAGEWQIATQPLLAVGALSAGRYTLEVRRVSPSNNETAELRYVFRVQAAWQVYQALIGFVIVSALLLVLLLFYWRSKVFRDQAQQLKQAVFQKTAKIELQKKELNASNVHLQRILDVRQHIMAHLSHELRTPLQLSLGLLSDLRPYCQTPSKIDIAERNVAHALHVTEQLLARDVFALVEPDKTCEQLVGPIIQACCLSWQAEAEKKQIALCLEDHIPEDTCIDLAPYHLEMILGNLLSNAMKYTDSKGGITVNVKQHEKQLVISVSDTGRGMSEQTKAHLFDNYYQEEAQYTAEGGFGLGLGTVKQLVEQYSGTISVISYQGVGSEFIIRLPLVVGTLDQEGQDVGQEASDLRRWVMVIGDEADAQSDWSKQLSEHCHVSHTRGDYEDLMLLEDPLPELVMVDRDALEPSDEELLQGLKDEFFVKKGPVIVALCSANEGKRPQPVSWADHTLQKPLLPHTVVAEIGHLLSLQQSLAESGGLQNKEWQDNVQSLVSNQFQHTGFGTSAAAKALYMSERTFQRRFKQEFGLPFKDYVTQFRFEQATVMLRQGDNVSDVALACGFKDPSYFSTRFKAYCGQTPTEVAASSAPAE